MFGRTFTAEEDTTLGASPVIVISAGLWKRAFGSDPATWKSASPMTHIASDTGIPSYLVAARGPEMRLDLHLEFANALRAANVPVTVLDAQTLDHATVSTNIGAPGDTVMTPAVMDFLDRCFEPR